MATVESYLRECAGLVEGAMERYLPAADRYPQPLHEAMRYSVYSGGKRLRPALCLAAAEACGGAAGPALPAACALEFIHTYSLIHDDLPAMDNDDFRRGRPTSHRVFGEAIAILAGDALLTLAFRAVVDAGGGDSVRTLLVAELAEAAGAAGMVGGQAADMISEGGAVDVSTLEYIHGHKTGALLRAAVRIGALAAGADGGALALLTEYAERIGLAFQIVDDLLDAAEAAGGGDAAHGKATYPAVHGKEASLRMVAELTEQALDALARSAVQKQDRLAAIAAFLGRRDR